MAIMVCEMSFYRINFGLLMLFMPISNASIKAFFAIFSIFKKLLSFLSCLQINRTQKFLKA